MSFGLTFFFCIKKKNNVLYAFIKKKLLKPSCTMIYFLLLFNKPQLNISNCEKIGQINQSLLFNFTLTLFFLNLKGENIFDC